MTTFGYDYNGKKYESQELVCKAVVDEFVKQHPNLIGVTQREIFRYKCTMNYILGNNPNTAEYEIFLTIEKRRWGTDIEAFFCVAPNCTFNVELEDYFFTHPFPRN